MIAPARLWGDVCLDLFVVRHGESVNNYVDDFGGDHPYLKKSADPPLMKLGTLQARAAAEALAPLGLERLYCSPQLRALQTASIIAERLGIRAEARPDLRERSGENGGTYHGMTASEIRARFPLVDLGPGITEEGWWFDGEEYVDSEEVFARACRVASWLWEIAAEPRKCGLISHGAFGAVMMWALVGLPNKAPVKFGQDNCAIGRLAFKPDGLRILGWNDTHHMPADMAAPIEAEAV